jgi:hypothetical protein
MHAGAEGDELLGEVGADEAICARDQSRSVAQEVSDLLPSILP